MPHRPASTGSIGTGSGPVVLQGMKIVDWLRIHVGFQGGITIRMDDSLELAVIKLAAIVVTQISTKRNGEIYRYIFRTD